MPNIRILTGEALDHLRALPDDSVGAIVIEREPKSIPLIQQRIDRNEAA